jgi:hypothetical protein
MPHRKRAIFKKDYDYRGTQLLNTEVTVIKEEIHPELGKRFKVRVFQSQGLCSDIWIYEHEEALIPSGDLARAIFL